MTEIDIHDTVTPGGFSGHNAEYTYGKVFNLFLDPKEEHSFTVRKLVWMPVLGGIQAQHLKTFEKYPPHIQVKGGAPV
jgi:arylsulfatase